LRPSKQPPIPFGGTLTYQCPGVKSVSGFLNNSFLEMLIYQETFMVYLVLR